MYDDDDWNSADTWGLMVLTIVLIFIAGLGYYYFGKNLLPGKTANVALFLVLCAVIITSVVGIFFQPLGWASGLGAVLVVLVPMIFKKLGTRR